MATIGLDKLFYSKITEDDNSRAIIAALAVCRLGKLFFFPG